MSSNKQLLALNLDGLELSALLCRPGKGRIKIEIAEKHRLTEPIKETTGEVPTLEIGAGPAISAEDIFGSDEKTLTASLDEAVAAAPEDESRAERSNEEVLQSILRSAPSRNFNYAVNLPASISQVIQLRNGYGQIKKTARRKKIFADVGERLNKPVEYDRFDYFVNNDNNVFAFAYTAGIPLLSLFESVQIGLKKHFRLVSILPDEVALLNLIRINYNPAEEDVLIIVHIALEESKIVITKGGQVTQIAPPINDDSNSAQLLKTITGKILYEQSLGNIPERYRVILTGQARHLDAVTVFQRTLETTDVDYFTANPDLFRFTPEAENSLSEFAVPLGNAVTVFFSDDKRIIPMALIPDYINRRQRVLKLAWHGYILLLMIFMAPLWFNYQYTKKSKTMATFTQKKVQLEKSVNELKWVESRLDSLVTQTKLGKQKLGLLETLSAGTHKWSYTLEKTIRAIHSVEEDLWLTEINTQGNGFQILGVSLYRNRAPRLAAQFPSASVENVTPVEIRGSMVYQFRINVDKITEDEKNFDPVVKIPDHARLDLTDENTAGTKTLKTAALFQKAVKLYNQGKIGEALPFFEQLAGRTQDSVYAANAKAWVGKCNFASGDYQQAITVLSSFIGENPESEEKLSAMLFLGKAFAATNQKKEARELFLSIVKQSPTSEVGLEASQLIATLH